MSANPWNTLQGRQEEMADSEATLVAKQHRGDQIGGVGRVFGDVVGREGLHLVHRDQAVTKKQIW